MIKQNSKIKAFAPENNHDIDNLYDYIEYMLETKLVYPFYLEKNFKLTHKQSLDCIEILQNLKAIEPIEEKPNKYRIINEEVFKNYASHNFAHEHYIHHLAFNISLDNILLTNLYKEDRFIEKINKVATPPIGLDSTLERKKDHMVNCILDEPRHYIVKIVALQYLIDKQVEFSKYHLNNYWQDKLTTYLKQN